MRRKKTKMFGKIVARIDLDNFKRLSEIRDKYGFSSNYEIIQYLVACFLRVADPEHDETEEPVPDEIKDMFADYSEAEKHFEFVKPKRKLPQYKLDEIHGQLRLWEN
ncbi:MAG: hypothetical protein ACLSCE_04180 [Bacteroides cellulosilyticus]|jgi:hypothetical protein|uniref:hypothetical protein n=1 Tax=Bacteroides cellulosilyticus TaxID=246787 RepID=UPI0020471C5C|nr:hypothetical protein [Bacteroides cellulosilyticus]UWZ88844.1 hypothetical protein NWT25_21260 [Bacteroides cellulosilyticus]DAN98042.1 MAG TPA: hypothetical protein [Caudoviricetes sp.]